MQKAFKNAAVAAMTAAAGLTAVVTTPNIASAQPYYGYGADCGQRRTGNTIAGAIIGGIAGAFIGNGVARHGERGDGALIGGALGAAGGAAIGNSSTSCYDRGGYYSSGRYYRPYGAGYQYQRPYYARPYDRYDYRRYNNYDGYNGYYDSGDYDGDR